MELYEQIRDLSSRNKDFSLLQWCWFETLVLPLQFSIYRTRSNFELWGLSYKFNKSYQYSSISGCWLQLTKSRLSFAIRLFLPYSFAKPKSICYLALLSNWSLMNAIWYVQRIRGNTMKYVWPKLQEREFPIL